MNLMHILTGLRKIRRILRWIIVIAFFVLISLDVYIQLEAHFISKPFWKPPLVTGLVITMAYLIISYALNQLLMILASYPQLSVVLIGILVRIAYNLWIRRKPPDYIVITKNK